jgi:DnaJ-class molecular chaperone
VIKYRSEQIINPKTMKVFRGKGMPIYSDDPLSPLMMNHQRGNFVLKFHVHFPAMTSEQKEKLVAALIKE